MSTMGLKLPSRNKPDSAEAARSAKANGRLRMAERFALIVAWGGRTALTNRPATSLFGARLRGCPLRLNDSERASICRI